MRLNLTQNVRNAFRALIANKLRTSLTMLGIVIGVSSVVALLAVGTGAQSAITGQIQGLGANLISVIASVPRNSLPGQVNTTPAHLMLKDAEQLVGLPGVAVVAPQFRTTMRLTNQGTQASATLTGVVPDYALIHPDQVDQGRFIEASDENNKARVVVLGSQTATDLFSGLDPIGQPVKINGVLFSVIGVLKSQGGGLGGFSRDAVAYVPLATAYTKLVGAQAVVGGDRLVSMIEVSAVGESSIDTAISAVSDTLRRSHQLKASDDDDFLAVSQTDLLSVTNTITGIMTVFLGAISAISLVVGGIGVMNIMLVSVTERTKEIGLRKAVGARRRDILYQFLTETVTLALFGGIIGILIGAGIAALVNLTGVITTRVSIESILLAFGFSAAVGIFFGIYPANRAASLHPIEALRYE